MFHSRKVPSMFILCVVSLKQRGGKKEAKLREARSEIDFH